MDDLKKSNRKYLRRGIIIGIASIVFFVLFVNAITITINSFSSGEVISAASINQNFNNLKNAVLGIDTRVIALEDKVYAYYWSDTLIEVDHGVNATLIFEDKIADSHNSYNTSTGEFICPKSWILTIDCNIRLSLTDQWGNSEKVALILFKNENELGAFSLEDMPNGLSNYYKINKGLIKLNVTTGDRIKIKVSQNSDVDLTLTGAIFYNRVYFDLD